MNIEIIYTAEFLKEVKSLRKHYPSFRSDFEIFLASLKENPLQGKDLGEGIRKIRMAITSKGKGKSGGARVITYNALIATENGRIRLVTIYDKSKCDSISKQEIWTILRKYEGEKDTGGGGRRDAEGDVAVEP
ncbi:MAG: type II toxin-antitoxin system RelE/ParE family toxin [Bacteroidales bacterium]|nr:type II toxin-antitoxin system RelE/ParE family toxin [Bacteroidales bacterium]